MFLHAGSEDSDQTGQMPWLIRIFAGCTDLFVGCVVLWLIYFTRTPGSSENQGSNLKGLMPNSKDKRKNKTKVQSNLY